MVKGTENVLRSVNKADSVRRVIFTSAVGALYGQNDEKDGPLDEKDWNQTSSLKVCLCMYSTAEY
jgi:nucleoside-diphosphate-sugar epimerase